jgi:hypothetical protein
MKNDESVIPHSIVGLQAVEMHSSHALAYTYTNFSTTFRPSAVPTSLVSTFCLELPIEAVLCSIRHPFRCSIILFLFVFEVLSKSSRHELENLVHCWQQQR